MNVQPLLLLVGSEAVALASRLSASGYATVDWLRTGVASSEASFSEGPAAAILASDQISLIGDLRDRFGSMPILLDLKQDSIEARSTCLLSGADDFWLSTIGPSDLLLRLRLHQVIQTRSGQHPVMLQVGDLSLDPISRQVRRGQKPIPLTAREFALLLVLMKRSGRVLTRQELLQEVWHDERVISSNVVEVYVRYLRQKLEEGGEPRLLHTVRGRGYRFGPKPS
ncbi:MAG: DNA-binding response regulator [Cyanobium sp. NAT70]|nr:DNA-binding response regulator [Cyanobium sp. NAT70]